jgi:hypothetical protein
MPSTLVYLTTDHVFACFSPKPAIHNTSAGDSGKTNRKKYSLSDVVRNGALSIAHSYLAEIEHLINLTHIVDFPAAPVAEKVPYERWPQTEPITKKKRA